MTQSPSKTPLLLLALAVLFVAGVPYGVAQATTFTILNADSPGEGLNDSTPVAPVTGNSGTTIGQQRINVFQAAADAWGDVLNSSVDIPILAGFDDLSCSPTSGVLGAAGPSLFISGGGGFFPMDNTWYPFALANAVAGDDLSDDIGLPLGTANIVASFNSAVDDDPFCLTGVTWWYGIGANAPGGTIDFFTTVFHEIAHGLGFTTAVDVQTGEKLPNSVGMGLDDVYMKNLEDHSTGELWPGMTNGERANSAVDSGDLHWVGPNAVAEGGMLGAGTHPSGHIEMYSPDPLEQGSSVSHWDGSLFPNEVMEPFINNDAEDIVTTELMEDIGWPVFAPVTPCVPSSTTLCLNKDRFKVEIDWKDFTGGTGVGQVVPGGSDDSANIWFFGPNNWELLIKVLTGCDINNNYWVFFAATTNVEFTVTVTDTQSGVAREYFNPLGQSADAVTDTSAFATCP